MDISETMYKELIEDRNTLLDIRTVILNEMVYSDDFDYWQPRLYDHRKILDALKYLLLDMKNELG